MEGVVRAPAGMQQLRVFLLGSLLYYLTLTQQPDTPTDPGEVWGVWLGVDGVDRGLEG